MMKLMLLVSHAARRMTAIALTALIALATALMPARAAADVPLWRVVKKDLAEFRISADRRIVRDPRLAFVLQERLRHAETEVRQSDAHVRTEIETSKKQGLTWGGGNGSYEESLRLLGMTERHAAVLTQSAMCAAGSPRCYSSEHVDIYRLSDRAKFKDAEALDLEGGADLLRRLVGRDRTSIVGRFGVNCDQDSDSDDCPTLGELLGIEDDDMTPPADARIIENFTRRVAGVGFTTDAAKRVTTLDIHISSDSAHTGHYGAYRWSLDIALAAPLLKPALRDLAPVQNHATPAAAKPAATVTTRALDASVTVDKALRAHPGLYENLLAEGQRELAKQRAAADAERRKEPEFFREGRRWTFERSYDLRSVVGRYVSVTRNDSSYAGGAHGNVFTDTILWDREAKKRISIRPFFTELADNGPAMTLLAEQARLAVAALKIERAEDKQPKPTPQAYLAEDTMLKDAIEAKLLKIGPISLAPSTLAGKSSGLTFHYSPYAVGSHAEGPYTAFVPWTAFRQFLSTEGAAIFGGERPKSDEGQS